MKKEIRLMLAAAATSAGLLLPLHAAAQSPVPPPPPAPPAPIELGQWQGTVSPPSAGDLRITADFSMAGDTLKLTLNVVEMSMVLPATDIRRDGTKLSFTVHADEPVMCSLDRREDGALAGTCADMGGEPGPMVLLPPKKAPAGG